MLPQLIVFDLDGTLVDSAVSVSMILNEMRSEAGKTELPKGVFERWISLGAEILVANAMDLTTSEVGHALVDFRARYAEMKTPIGTVYYGALDALHYLKSTSDNLK